MARMTASLFLCTCALISTTLCYDFPPPRELYTLSWTGGQFVWPSSTVRSMYKNSGKYVSRNVVATRAAIFRDEVYAVFPRYLPGVPATLAKASLLSPNFEAVFEPFPSWEAQTEGDCGALQNVVDIHLDRRDVLWVLDSGVTQTLDNPVRQCPPKVVGYDLVTGKQVHQVDLSGLTTGESRLQYVLADFDPQDRRFLYISDAANSAIIVYNVAEDTGYRVQLPPSLTQGCPGGSPDILYLALAKPRTGGRRLYFSFLCGDDLYSVRAEDLQAGVDHGDIQYVATKPGRMIFIGADYKFNIYFRFEGQSDVYSWDVNTPLDSENIHLIHKGDSVLLATQAVMDPLRAKVRLLQSNVMDFLKRSVGVGAIHVLSSV